MLQNTINKLIFPSKGILAADESTNTIGKRFKSINVENTEKNRRDYREILLSTPNYEKYISGVILYEETLYQKSSLGEPIINYLKNKDIVIGIKVDKGLESFSDDDIEKTTKGLEDLEERCNKYYKQGARFTKWRAVFKIDKERNYPSHLLVDRNVQDLVKFALTSISCNLVPIIEPEILMDGNFSMDEYANVSKNILKTLFNYLRKCEVDLRYVVLKTNMIVPSTESQELHNRQIIAHKTYETINSSVDPNIPCIVYLSGGQTENDACANLYELCNHYQNTPWLLSFSYGRALQASALIAWQGDNTNKNNVQNAFLERTKLTAEAMCNCNKN